MPRLPRATAMAARTSASMSRPGTGRTWMVTSRPTSDCQSLAALTTIITAPVVNAARKVMMATTAVSDRPAIDPPGTIGVGVVGASVRDDAVSPPSHGSVRVLSGSVVDMQPSFVEDQAAGVVFVHQRDIVGGDDDGGARLVELDEQPQQALPEIGIDVAGRLVGEQKLRPRDYRSRNRGALLFAAGEHRRQRPQAIAQPDPLQQLHDLGAVRSFILANHPKRQRHVLKCGQMVEQP